MFWRKKVEKRVPRHAPRMAPRPKQREFEAVGARLLSSWETNSSNINQYICNNLVTLSSRSREQIRNNEYARRFNSLSKSNIIGSKGITYQSQVVDSAGDYDDVVNTELESAFKDWGIRHCSVNNNLTWIDIQNLTLSSMLMDGDAFIEIIEAGKYNMKLRLIDPMQVCIHMNHPAKNGNEIRMGIEYDSNDMVVAYHVTPVSESGYYDTYTKGRRVAANKMIHAYRPEWVGQERGIPWMTAALYRMKMLHGYDEAAIGAARYGAAKMGFYKPDPDAEDADFGDDGVSDEVTPGLLETLPNGWDFESHDPDYPHEQYPHFTKACLRGMSAGLDVSYNTLANDLEGVNYSSIRAGVLEDREMWKALQEMFIHRVADRVTSRWIESAYLKEAVRINNMPLNRGMEYYKKYTLQGRRWSWVDPLKDINAARNAVELRTRSISSIIRESGGDPEEVYREIASDQQKLTNLGITDETE